VYIASAELLETVPAIGIAFVELEVNLKVLEPFLNFNDPFLSGSLKKNAPYTSPYASARRFTLSTFASALLSVPRRTTSPDVL
jgi:hypothetical protein